MAKTKPIVHLHYPNVAAMRTMAVTPCSGAYNDGLRQSFLNDNRGKDWLGIAGGGAAVARAIVDGYPEGEQAVREFHDSIKADLPRAEGIQRRKHRGSAGDELDYHATLRGQHDRAWTSSQRAIKRGSGILRLVVDIGGNCSVSAKELRWRGIAGLALSEVMTKAGYSVEIVAGFATSGIFGRGQGAQGIDQSITTCVVKPRGVSADYGLLAATLVLSGFYRTLGFAAIIKAADDQALQVSSGLGYYLDVSGVLPAPNAVTQLFVPQSVRSRDEAVRFVKSSINLLQG